VTDRLRAYQIRARAFKRAAEKVLATHESSPARVITLERTYDDLDELSLSQDDLFRQSLRCVEQGLFRAAHVMAWAAFMDFLEEKLAADGLVKMKALYPKWKGDTMEEMREYVSEYAFIEATQPLKLCTKNQMKALHGLLNRRNECAHPSDYYPGVNETMGFIAEVLQRVRQLQSKSL
jgi:hypothetical protein